MDDAYWEKHAEVHESNYNAEFAKFIRDLAGQLHCNSVLEVGCNAANDLGLFNESSGVIGIDYNPKIVKLAKQRFPAFSLMAGTATSLPYQNSSIDMVFTHGFLNYTDDGMVGPVIDEMFRVAARYVVNCEMLGDDSPIGGQGRRGRNMYKKWLDYKVKIISNVEMHEDIDPETPRFLLVRKL
ncbi:SAM dependent methyltransferase [Cenarchaeum symbiosum A]|uniref:SAM dependent methyltransferase n=1 Tax=Cenarchaeum symbiosum (strain A) TaxID=414004 RepID=A0RXD3_CENSY|nr:SAM dependent methyltransferase [Cenarchaeum symbiosum A]